ncbi:methyltransferase domain-containing protein [Liquorilactobacillus oeni]|uniref:rRNA large subunit methyltransferase A n=1 Tax=Liquorilactobacillus oeni DSM 19972 TaxID=1423777 RepID=A0A0R1MHQ9_9LACO|nr:methyltransferase domain-containing protein [Liquorilactobacillus oeni]KRL04786.1 rRNA large subunit methyltransferase A [Liquorilactobacillus oeni DSM 19972]
MKKIEQGMAFVAKKLALFSCPVCHSAFVGVNEGSASCKKGHSFDFSRKGTLYLLTHGLTSDYDDDQMWASRRILQQAGLFKPITDEINSELSSYKMLNILDVGCGEGSTIQSLEQQRKNKDDSLIGFDISKRAINLATQLETNAFFCVADLARLPFSDNCFDVLLDMFSPSSYEEFKRVLKKGGKLFKVVPNEGYLNELRHLLYVKDDPRHNYSNKNVVALFEKNFPKMIVKRLKYTLPLNADLFNNLIYMTPLHWGATQEKIAESLKRGLDNVTVDVSLLIAERE